MLNLVGRNGLAANRRAKYIPARSRTVTTIVSSIHIAYARVARLRDMVFRLISRVKDGPTSDSTRLRDVVQHQKLH